MTKVEEIKKKLDDEARMDEYDNYKIELDLANEALDELSTHYEGVIRDWERYDKTHVTLNEYYARMDKKDKKIAELQEELRITKTCNNENLKENQALRDENERLNTRHQIEKEG